ncbi:hypothetical protein BMF94_3238 [Rhodotorula taiwanensis]|uniref:MYND-type domain-containing protein n=1 Tax=Rhodotorula taiwanensis TaxID=741276 RepID=A0A2S5BAE8_9BASI|nr:hypothetical protein BMF94_3238 [Rhodotorula taiwanensis]
MGNCCVCGKETAQRCGPCGRAGVDLFFCSTVWPAHKQVCGPNSNPFCAPDLSREEASWLRQVARTSLELTAAEAAQQAGELAFGMKNTVAETLEAAFCLGSGGLEKLSDEDLMNLSSRPMPGSPSRPEINLCTRALFNWACRKAGVLASVLQSALHHAVVLELLISLRARSPSPPFANSALSNGNLARLLECLVQPLLPHCHFASDSDWQTVAAFFAAPLLTIGVDVVRITDAYNHASGVVERYSVQPI